MRIFLNLTASLLMLTVGLVGEPRHLERETLQHWNSHIAETKTRVTAETERPDEFLAVDCSSELRQRVHAGEIVVAPSRDNGYHNVPSGLIHSWTGSVFVPESTLSSMLRRVQGYGDYPSIYQRSIVSARLLSKTTDEFTYSFLLAQRVMLIDSALDGDYRSTFYRLGSTRAYSFTESTRLQEISNYGHANAERRPPDYGSGFIWRLASVTRYEEADGGVYIELEAMALSRTIPATLHWVVNPVVNRISQAAITVTLRQTRAADVPNAGSDEILPLAFR